MVGTNAGSTAVEIPEREVEEDPSRLTMTAAWKQRLAWVNRAWLVAFTLPFVGLLWHNHYLFSRKLFPTWDYAADTVLTLEARHFDLLVGNHSRLGFFHPGPADSYIRAGGQTLFYNLLHVVPSPWNAQVLTIFLLNCVLFATAVWIIDSWARSGMVLIAVLAVALGYLALHPYALDSPWMPNIYITPFLLLLVAAASVSRGRSEHLWALILAGGLLIHGHVCFFLFVPPIAGLALAVPAWQKRRQMKAFLRREWRHKLAAPLALAALFALPMILNLVLHWPGEFGKYLTYSSSGTAGGHSLRSAVRYSLWYWHTGPGPIYFLIGFGALAAVLTLKHSEPHVRGFLFALLAADLIATAAMVYYATSGVDDLTSTYIGKFTYMVPLTVLLVIAVNALDLIGRSRLERAVVATVGAAVILLAVHTKGSGDVLQFNDSNQPAVLASLDHAAGGRPIMFHYIDGADWQPTVGMIDVAAWNGKRLCFIGGFSILITQQYVCQIDDMRHGVVFNVLPLSAYRAQHSTEPILGQLTDQVIVAP